MAALLANLGIAIAKFVGFAFAVFEGVEPAIRAFAPEETRIFVELDIHRAKI
jgi:hypothetical protein